MTLTLMAQRVPTPRLVPATKTLLHYLPAHQFHSRGLFSTQRTRNSEWRASRNAPTTSAAACDSGAVDARSADFRRPLSAVVGSAAPRRPTLARGAPTISSPTLGQNTKSWRSLSGEILRPVCLLSITAPRAFSSSAAAMVATKIDGKAIAQKVRERLKGQIAEKKAINPRFQPCLKIIQGACVASRSKFINIRDLANELTTRTAVGDRPDSCKPPDHDGTPPHSPP